MPNGDDRHRPSQPVRGGEPVTALTGIGMRTYIRSMAHLSRLTDDRLAALYVDEGFGGNTTMRAKVIRELIDEIRALRTELADTRGSDSSR